MSNFCGLSKIYEQWYQKKNSNQVNNGFFHELKKVIQQIQFALQSKGGLTNEGIILVPSSKTCARSLSSTFSL